MCKNSLKLRKTALLYDDPVSLVPQIVAPSPAENRREVMEFHALDLQSVVAKQPDLGRASNARRPGASAL